ARVPQHGTRTKLVRRTPATPPAVDSAYTAPAAAPTRPARASSRITHGPTIASPVIGGTKIASVASPGPARSPAGHTVSSTATPTPATHRRRLLLRAQHNAPRRGARPRPGTRGHPAEGIAAGQGRHNDGDQAAPDVDRVPEVRRVESERDELEAHQAGAGQTG